MKCVQYFLIAIPRGDTAHDSLNIPQVTDESFMPARIFSNYGYDDTLRTLE